MLSIVYMSAARRGFTDDDLAVLLMNSRASNAQHGLTGMLIHRDGRFMQLLEGPDAEVVARYAKIVDDPRHTDVVLLAEEHTDTRRFPAWTMAYDPTIDLGADTLPGFDDFLTRPTVPSGTRAEGLLAWFRTHPMADPTI
jgi:hypothetical protein